MGEEQKNEKNSILENEWMIRSSSVYREEYSDCTSIRGRFHQYFVHGKMLDCSQWKRDLDNAYRWEGKNDIKSANEIIESEKIRRKERLQAHYNNDIWQKRESPPEDWNKPLPEFMQKEYKDTYLNIKKMEMEGLIEPVIDSKCSIM